MAAAGDDDALLELSVESLPDSARWLSFPGWTAGLLRRALTAMAASAGIPFEQFLLVAEARAEDAESRGEDALVAMRAELDRMRRERLLPAERELQNLQRYEAHLNRQLYQAVHELAVLQARRAGSPVQLSQYQFYGVKDS